METEAAEQAYHYGFITVVDVPEFGFCGGLLVLSENGRPKEFHCTAPVNANRAQQILYGKTLDSFLFCDQIGLALHQQAKVPIDILVTNNQELLQLALAVDIPVALVDLGELTQDAVEREIEAISQYVLGDSLESEETEMLLRRFIDTLPLCEPFERINRAIEEAHAVAQ